MCYGTETTGTGTVLTTIIERLTPVSRSASIWIGRRTPTWRSAVTGCSAFGSMRFSTNRRWFVRLSQEQFNKLPPELQQHFRKEDGVRVANTHPT